jgi:L-lactate dehydrogenase complex protein LldG
MSRDRGAFLETVRKAVGAGNRPGVSAEIAPRGAIGYQGAGADPSARFCEQFAAAGGQAHVVSDLEAAARKVLALAEQVSHRRILLGEGTVIAALNLRGPLQAMGCAVTGVEANPDDANHNRFFAADVGITGVDYLIAETGSIIYLARPRGPRSLSLLPPVHIVVASTDQLLPDLFDLFGLPELKETGVLPSCVSVITGPSKTGDIELTLVTGVHGPGEIHVVLIQK